MKAIDEVREAVERLKRVDPDIENNEIVMGYEKARLEDKQAVMALFAKYGKGLFSSKQLNCAIKISEGLDKIYKEV